MKKMNEELSVEEQLEQRLAEATEEHSALMIWLKDNVKSELFESAASRANHLSTNMHLLRHQLQFVRSGHPRLGYGEEIDYLNQLNNIKTTEHGK